MLICFAPLYAWTQCLEQGHFIWEHLCWQSNHQSVKPTDGQQYILWVPCKCQIDDVYTESCDETGPCIIRLCVMKLEQETICHVWLHLVCPCQKIDLCNTIGKWAVVLALVLSVLPKTKHSQGLPGLLSPFARTDRLSQLSRLFNSLTYPEIKGIGLLELGLPWMWTPPQC